MGRKLTLENYPRTLEARSMARVFSHTSNAALPRGAKLLKIIIHKLAGKRAQACASLAAARVGFGLALSGIGLERPGGRTVIDA